MPKRTDIKRILVIGSGPIVIGQACEFDYSGAQACKVLKEDGFEVILVNSNPATIMTDPGLADRTYVEPITAEFIERVIKKERPDALLPTLGGQTGLNAAVELAKDGTLDKYGVEMIGCDLAAIERGEDRKLFNEAMAEIGLEVARSGYAYSVADAEAIAERVGYPCVLRPSFTLGGAGGGIAHTHEELVSIVSQGLELSPAHEVLVEESIEGWKEYEMEVMRDRAGNGIIVCSIENFDAMGVHTGDSITVAPAQTLTDVEYQRMRAASLAILIVAVHPVSSYLKAFFFYENSYCSMLKSGIYSSSEKRFYLLRRCRCGNIPVIRTASQNGIPDTAAHYIGLISVLFQRIQNNFRTGRYIQLHLSMLFPSKPFFSQVFRSIRTHRLNAPAQTAYIWKLPVRLP